MFLTGQRQRWVNEVVTKNTQSSRSFVSPADQSFDAETVLDEAQKLVLKNYRVHSSTIQIERYAREMDTCKKCQTPVR